MIKYILKKVAKDDFINVSEKDLFVHKIKAPCTGYSLYIPYNKCWFFIPLKAIKRAHEKGISEFDI